jgi:protease I
MAQKTLDAKRVAVLATDGFEQDELMLPRQALDDAGAKTTVVSLHSGSIRGWKNKAWGESVKVDATIDEARSTEFDALLIPGGVMNPDAMRQNEKAVEFVREFFFAGKPVAAICHAPWMLVEAGVVRDRTLTSWPSLRTDIQNAGGIWEDRDVVTDDGLVTSRKPADIPAFNRKMLEEFAEGFHEGQRVSRRERDVVRGNQIDDVRWKER